MPSLNIPATTPDAKPPETPSETPAAPDPKQIAADADPVNVNDKLPIGTEKKDEPSFELSADFWQNKVPDATQPAVPTQQPVADKTGPTQAEIFDEHVKGLDFAPKEITDEQVAALFDNRDLSVLTDLINQGARNAYKQAMTDSASLVAAGEKKATEAARQMTQAQLGEREDILAMNTALPFTTKPAVAPVALAVFKQSLSKDKTKEEAIRSVRDFFAGVANIGQKELGLNPAPPPNPGDTGFKGNSQDDADEIDWEKVISSA